MSGSKPPLQSILQCQRIDTCVARLAEQVYCRYQSKSHEDVNENLLAVKPTNKVEILYLNAKHLSNIRKGGIVGKGVLAKLNDWECAQENQSNIKEKRRHVCFVELHGMNLEEHKANTKLETSLDGGK
jgi:hypothetical protein